MLVSRLPVAGKKVCLGLTHLLMLYLCWLMFRGAWQQTAINWGTSSAVMEVSTGWLYAAGVFFAVFAFLFLLADFWRLLSGQLSEAELIGVADSEEELPHEPGAATAGAK